MPHSSPNLASKWRWQESWLTFGLSNRFIFVVVLRKKRRLRSRRLASLSASLRLFGDQHQQIAFMPHTRTISRIDFVAGTLIATAMLCLFSLLSHGSSLLVTFVPGIVATWGLFTWLYTTQAKLPTFDKAAPIFMLTLANQFPHFAEEFMTGFRVKFPMLYGGIEYTESLFVLFNMISYAAFLAFFVIAYHFERFFLLVPPLFFIVYGALGNAISHTWWSLSSGAYFPGLYTAQFYWLLGPLALYQISSSKAVVVVLISTLAGVLVPLLWLFSK